MDTSTWDAVTTPSPLSEQLVWEALNVYEQVEEYAADGRLDHLLYQFDQFGNEGLPTVQAPDGAVYFQRGLMLASGIGYRVQLVVGEEWRGLEAWDATTLGMHIRSTKTIQVKTLDNPAMMARILFHEVAHALSNEVLHAYQALEFVYHKQTMRKVCECVAEGAAFLALGVLGLDTTPVSVPYLASYGLFRQPRNSIVEAMVIVARRILAVDERRVAMAYA